ncbi:alpha/beta-hydrolase [Aureobasidium subglaciale]|nr:alpha/beta-hydrolase [Aureobasidium subglaciale]
MRYNVQIPVIELEHPVEGHNGHQALNPHDEILPTGWHAQESTKTLTTDILVQHDFGVKVRDGVTLYMDILRPANDPTKVPAIICWSPFGKKFNGLTSLKYMTPWNLGLTSNDLSGLEKFEAPDPADWVPRGYAIVNVDSRGSFNSEGVMSIMGSQEAEDGYDVIEALAKEPWCNGNVGLAGNSHLAIIQWFIAALNPPSLKAIAPWEGCGDLYREQFARGGIYAGDLFDELIVKHLLKGRQGMESFREMFKQYPLATPGKDDWWNNKRPDMTKINIPTYITGTWTNTMHGMGAIRAWLEVSAEKKWLRWHPYQEWYDLWGCQQAKDELLMFMDHYLKDVDNDWEATPKIRMAVLRFGEKEPIANKIVADFPIPNTKYQNFYLQPGGEVKLAKVSGPSKTASYDGKVGVLSFKHVFEERTQVVGLPKAVLYMSCHEYDDMDIYVTVRKLSTSGEPMYNLNIPWSSVPVAKIEDIPEDKRTEVVLYKGPVGILRASHRDVDTSKSMHENWPFHPHEKMQKVKPGDVVKLEIGIWAMGVEYEAGEGFQFEISGHHRGMKGFGNGEHSKNEGKHVLHFGGVHDSRLILPIIPNL